MDYKNLKISEYMDSLASSAPAPGGGPVAALSCAEGAGLCIMVCELSIGKKKFEEYDSLLKEVLLNQKKYKDEFLNLMNQDSIDFKEMEKVFKMPKETDEEIALRNKAMQEAFKTCLVTPLNVVELALKSISETKKIVGKSSSLASSDLEVSALMLEAGARGALVNVKINTKNMEDKAYAQEKNAKADELINKISKISSEILDALRK
jgi:formiminotetrahydrofolate cyclodeaminase